MSILSGAALADYGHPVFKRDGFVCVYCGFDGNGFNHWRQLTVDWLRPADAGGTDSDDNLVTACGSCSSAMSRMKFAADRNANEILKLKKEYAREHIKGFYKFWLDEVAPRDTVLTPEQGGPYSPHPLLLDVSSLELTGQQLEKISSDNDDLRLELTAKGELVIVPPAHSWTGWRNGKLTLRLGVWAEEDGTGLAFDSSAGFTLPDGAILAPDASWILRERWDALDEEKFKSFAHICPDFVLELRSQSDTLVSVQRKMEEYIENGCRLGWLIDPVQKRVHIYRPGVAAEVLEDPESLSGEPVLPGFELDLREIW